MKEGIPMDIKKIIEDLIEKVKNDKDFGKKFKDDPVKAVEGIVGVDLPDDKINEIINGIKAKVNLDEIGEKLGGLGGLLDKLKK
ncbi:MAG: hypothetical protein J6L99_02705 [Ruminococcus sp.]|jgi:methyl coenzyme M reductase subunit C|nr:hypothetical protein [Ruminococcus sp.]